MALFSAKKNTTEKAAGKSAAPKTAAAKKVEKSEALAVKALTGEAFERDFSWVLIQPRVTEKASVVAEKAGAYTFEVSPRATKHDVVRAVSLYFKVTPVKVAMTRIPAKKVFIRGKMGMKSGGKKAYVYLKKGETIEFI